MAAFTERKSRRMNVDEQNLGACLFASRAQTFTGTALIAQRRLIEQLDRRHGSITVEHVPRPFRV